MTTTAPSGRRFRWHTAVRLPWVRCHQEPLRMRMFCGLLCPSARDITDWRSDDDGRRQTSRRRRRGRTGGGKDPKNPAISHVDAIMRTMPPRRHQLSITCWFLCPPFFSSIPAVLTEIGTKRPKKKYLNKSSTTRTPPPILGDFSKFC